MSDVRTTLNTAHTQVLIDFFEDQHYSWHHRLLVVELSPGRWASVTPDLDVETVDLSGHRVLPLARSSPFPARAQSDMYVFDEVSPADMRRVEQECLQLARLLGVVGARLATAEPEGHWRVADTASPDFDVVVVSADMNNPDRAVTREDAGLVFRTASDGASSWTFVERVTAAAAKRSGPGRDLRLAGCARDGVGRRFASLSESLSSFRDTRFEDWPFRGTKATPELLMGIQKSGHELATYDLFWAQQSGAIRASAVALSHKHVMAVLSLLQSYDQVDMTNLAGVEYFGPWALMIQAAVRKSPKSPSFQGLESFLSHSFDETGGVVVSQFQKYIAEEQKSGALVLKQHRLWNEERDADDKKRRDNHKKPAGGGGPAGLSS